MTKHVDRVSRLADLQDRIRATQRRLTEIDNELISLNGKLIDDTEVTTGLADLRRITTARMTQIMTLLNLAPDIQEQILFLPRTEHGRDVVKESDIRPIASTLDWRKQRRMWAALCQRGDNSAR